jgi:hypothetical protein
MKRLYQFTFKRQSAGPTGPSGIHILNGTILKSPVIGKGMKKIFYMKILQQLKILLKHTSPLLSIFKPPKIKKVPSSIKYSDD